MFFEDGKSNFSFLINGYLEREEDFFPDEETRLNTYDSCIWYSPDGSEENALIWPGIYQTSWLPELIDNFRSLLEGGITEFDFDILLFDPLDFVSELPVYDIDMFDMTIKFHRIDAENFTADIMFKEITEGYDIPKNLWYKLDDIDVESAIDVLTEWSEKYPYRPVNTKF